MGTYTTLAVTRRTIPHGKEEEIAEWVHENMLEVMEEPEQEGLFLEFTVRKFREDNARRQPQKLAEKLGEVYEERKRSHWGEKEIQVFKRSEYSDFFTQWNWREHL